MSTIMAKTPSTSPALQYEMISLTHTGRVREHNEDAVAFDALAQVAVLADGMGGYAAEKWPAAWRRRRSARVFPA
jgi:Serine/threonine protein phosphatase